MTVQQMIQKLLNAGITGSEIARTIGVSSPSVHQAKNGGGMRYEHGKKLEKMCEELEK